MISHLPKSFAPGMGQSTEQRLGQVMGPIVRWLATDGQRRIGISEQPLGTIVTLYEERGRTTQFSARLETDALAHAAQWCVGEIGGVSHEHQQI